MPPHELWNAAHTFFPSKRVFTNVINNLKRCKRLAVKRSATPIPGKGRPFLCKLTSKTINFKMTKEQSEVCNLSEDAYHQTFGASLCTVAHSYPSHSLGMH